MNLFEGNNMSNCQLPRGGYFSLLMTFILLSFDSLHAHDVNDHHQSLESRIKEGGFGKQKEGIFLEDVQAPFMEMVRRARLELAGIDKKGGVRGRGKASSTAREDENSEKPPWPLLTRMNETSPFFDHRETTEESENFSGEEELDEQLSIEVEYEEVYHTLIFLAVAFLMGKLFEFIGMPSLVGEIVTGFLLGPPLADYVPFPEAMVLLGEIGLILLLVEAGIEIDVAQLKLTGTRSVLIACIGSMLPLVTGLGLAMAFGLSVRTAIALGICFSPTSLGVASNALSAGKVANTPVGQIIIAACVVDDIIGLVLLSLLEVLIQEDAKIYQYFIPLISSFGYLIVLGLSALTWMPRVINKMILSRFREETRDVVALLTVSLLLFGYLPLLYYSKASYLTGAFLTGLAFSQIPSVHHAFIQNTKQLMAWLLRIFFAASIGFQIPIKHFGDPYVVGRGAALYAAVLAKLPLGLLVPHFKEKTPNGFPFNPRIRDALITGFAMTCRGEFSFIIASFSLGEKLFDNETYSSVVFAILLSCITSPFLLLFTIKYYNGLSAKFLEERLPLMSAMEGGQIPLYLVIQARTGLKWGLQQALEKCAADLGLSMIDHRSWHPRGLDATVVTEMYVEDTQMTIDITNDTCTNEIDERRKDIQSALMIAIGQPTAKVEVLQWKPNAFNTSKTNLPRNKGEQQESRSWDKLSPEEKKQILASEADSELVKKEVIDTKVDEVPQVDKKIKSLSCKIMKFGEGETDQTSAPTVSEGRSTNEFQDNVPELSAVRVRQRRKRQFTSPELFQTDLWAEDQQSQRAAKHAFVVSQVRYDLTSGPAYGVAQHNTIQPNLDSIMEELPSVEERLGGYVRHEMDEIVTETGQQKAGAEANDDV